MSRPRSVTPYPLDPLLGGLRLSRNAVAARVGVNRVTVYRAAHRGLSERQADEWACALGLHPIEVWPELWLALCPDVPHSGTPATYADAHHG